MAFDRHDPTDDENTAKIIEVTVQPATHALDGLGLLDKDLDAFATPRSAKRKRTSARATTRLENMKNKSSTTAQLRGDIDSGETGSKVAAADPAASPLGTDDEAAGTTPSADRVEMARNAEKKIGEAAKRRER